MKQLTIAVAAITAAFAFASPLFAEDAHHPEQAAAAQPSAGEASRTIKDMQDNVKKMRGQLDRAAKARTDSERQAVLAEHMRTMQVHMSMVHGMAGGMAMGCPMMSQGMGQGMGMMGMGRMGGGPAAAAPSAAAEDRLQRMEKRMEMMEKMLQQQGGSPAPMPTR